ncbi:MAG: cytidine deaminase [Chloroflexi bacterium RBG_13_56_8]|nr:MAG: cytidine deaminase [Chloroflexi bacterium RBG_13_56_8]
MNRDAFSPEWRELIDAASKARGNAYAPYSRFPVGAAVRAASGRIYAGCNVENASFGLTVCAERVAIWKAVSEGERDLQALAVVTEDGSAPCGACRQVMSEFVKDMPIAVADVTGHVRLTSLAELFPYPFSPISLDDGSSDSG